MKNISKEKTILIFKRNKDNRIYKVIGDFDILTKTFIPIYKKTQSTISKYPEFNRVNIYYKESEDDEYHEFTSETLNKIVKIIKIIKDIGIGKLLILVEYKQHQLKY